MPALIGVNANAQQAGGGTTTKTVSFTTGASDTFAFIQIAAVNNDATAATYNGSACTLVSAYVGASVMHLNGFYIANPTVGANNLIITTTGTTDIYVGWLPMSGVNLVSPVGAAQVSSASNSTNSPTVTVTGGTANDLYIASCMNFDTAQTSNGAPQNNVWYLPAAISSSSASGDYIVGNLSGVFGWTGTGTSSGALSAAAGILINGLAADILMGGSSQ